MTRLPLLGGLGLLAVAGVVYASGRVAAHGGLSRVFGEPWYDATPLLASLRPEARAELAHALGAGHAEDMTLYDLDLSYHPDAATFTLGEDVWFTNTTTETLPDLVFRIYADAAPPDSGPPVHLSGGSCVGDGACAVTVVNASSIRVQPSAPIAPGGRLHVKLTTNGALTHIDSSRTNFLAQGMEGMKSVFGGGSGGGDYGLLAVGDGIVSFANFYPVLARRQAGAWETEEASKLGDLGSDVMANVRARIELPADARLAVVGVVSSEHPVASPDSAPRREVRVVAGAIRDFALVFGEGLQVATRDVDGVQVRSYFLGADRVAGEHVLDVAAHALQDFERRFGRYPYVDYDVAEAAIVGGAGGVEFSGMVTAASMFYHASSSPSSSPTNGPPPTNRPSPLGGPSTGSDADPIQALLGGGAGADAISGLLAQMGGGGLGLGAAPEGMLEFVVAHETAHQWWHCLVGSDSRDHPYVDEALAQYSSLIYLADRYGQARAEKDGLSNVKMNYQSMRMMGKDDAAADQPVAAYSNGLQYAGIIYGKAPYFYRAVRTAIGDAAFFSAMRAYVAKYRFVEAPGRGLVDLLAAAGGDAKVRPLARRWLDETHGDEDLGKLDMASMLGSVSGLGGAFGGAGGSGGGPDMAELQKMMQMLQGAGGAFGGAGGQGNAATPGTGDVDVQELLKRLGAGTQ